MLKKFLYIILILFFAVISPAVAADFKISDIKTDNSGNLMVLKGNILASTVTYGAAFSQNPLRAYIDLDNCILVGNKKTFEFKNNPITKVVIAQYSTHPNKVRLVFYSNSIANLKAIKLIKNGNSLTFKLKNFEYADTQIPVIFSDILPKEYKEVKELSIDKAKYSSFILTNIYETQAGMLLSGVGNVKLSRPFILTNPIRIVFDLQNAIVQKKEFYGGYTLSNGDKVKIGQFTPNTLRFVVTTNTPVLYKAFISPDLQSVFLANIDDMSKGVLTNTNEPSLIKKIDIKQTSDTETFITIDFDAPVIHALRKTYNKFLIDFLNVDYTRNNTLVSTIKTKQFNGFSAHKTSEKLDALSLMFPVSDTLKVETGMTQDGKRIAIKLTGKLEEAKPQTIVAAKDNKTPIKKETLSLPLKNKVIIVDAGHGGKDAGAVSGKMYEKEPALKMALLLQKNLEAKGAKVIMTRDNDTFVSLQDRVSISNFENADLFVSIHLNSSEKNHINGIETHWYKPNSKDLANYVHSEIAKNIKANDRGLFKSMFYVINHTSAPAILVETGFISNPQERNELFTSERQKKTAQAISDGIVEYFKKR